jgi:hypothetical protein
MPAQVVFPQYRNELGTTNYPFAAAANLTSQDGFTIAQGTILDASLYPIGVSQQLYISLVKVASDLITFSFSDAETPNLATASFPTASPPALLDVFDALGRPAGILVSEPNLLAAFSTWAPGSHKFLLGTTEFVASCVIPTPQTGLRAVVAPDGTLLTGDVWLVGQNGVVVRQDTDGAIRFDAVGEPLFLRQECHPTPGGQNLFTTPNFLQTINDCPPDQYGNWNLTPGANAVTEPILRIYPANGQLVLTLVGPASGGA